MGNAWSYTLSSLHLAFEFRTVLTWCTGNNKSEELIWYSVGLEIRLLDLSYTHSDALLGAVNAYMLSTQHVAPVVLVR